MLAGLPRAWYATRSATPSAPRCANSTSSNGWKKTALSQAQADEARASCACSSYADNKVHAEYVAEMARQLIFAQYGK